MRIESCERWLYRFLVFLAASAAYLYGFPSATISYAVVDLLHVAVGVLAFLLLVAFFVPLLRGASNLARLGWKKRRSEEHTSELQSQSNLVCRLLLEKKKKERHTQTVEIIQPFVASQSIR